MALFNGKFPSLALPSTRTRLRPKSLGNGLLLALIPAVVLITAVTGFVSYRISLSFLSTALERNVRILDLAMAHAVENLLEQARRDLAGIAQESGLTPARMRDFLLRTAAAGGIHYREMAYISAAEGATRFLVTSGGQVVEIETSRLNDIRPNPYLLLEREVRLEPGEADITPVTFVEHPFPAEGQGSRRIAAHVIRLVIPYSPKGKEKGLLLLGLDARDVRNVLSLYNSPASPLWGYPRSDEVRYAYFFDPEGWIMFQSEDVNAPESALATYLARAGYEGTLGRAGMQSAFRPNSNYGAYWRSVVDLAAGKADLVMFENGEQPAKASNSFFAYAPVRFAPGTGKEPRVYAGVAFVDRSKLTEVAGYKHLDVMFIITLAAILLLSLLVWALAKVITAPILRLAQKAQSIHAGAIRPIELPTRGYETGMLRDALNHLIAIMERQAEEVRLKDEALKAIALRERASLEGPGAALPGLDEPLPAIVGVGARIEKLKGDILKAAQADVDVLILGETGAGKQLAAEAIHAHSARCGRPFIAINCGALDENLLLDTLFGHVKGAFTEAKADRKGAFLEADGGTLFLDEIQAASARVQQSLLRAIEARKIKPLGSDSEVDVDVRLIAATNINLAEAIERGAFREDLYFRLRVISIVTPALRDHAESIPLLAMRFLADAEQVVGKSNLGFTRGALKKLTCHHWPGNIRELKNCITMAAVMAEGQLIQAADILLGGEESGPLSPRPGVGEAGQAAAPAPVLPAAGRDPWGRSAPRVAEDPARSESRSRGVRPEPAPAAPADPAPFPPAPAPAALARCADAPPDLNPRQRAAWPFIAAAGDITRARYQEAVGGDLPARTAIYDLQDLVKRGLLTRIGRGPATCYIVTRGRGEIR